MDLRTGIFKPYMKDNVKPVYMNVKSNHPPTVLNRLHKPDFVPGSIRPFFRLSPGLVLKNIPLEINRRLSRISANKTVFDAAAPVYQEALIQSGYTHTLAYKPPSDMTRNVEKGPSHGSTHPTQKM
jgi:hypothetical protein